MVQIPLAADDAAKRWAKGLTVPANYTWSKSIDIASYATIEGNSAGPDPFNFNNNRGVSDFDIPHRLVVSGVGELPQLDRFQSGVRAILGGWQSNFILTAQAGTPFTVLSGVDNALMGIGGNFADLTGQDWRQPGDRARGQEVQEWFNKAAFAVNAQGTIGTGRRNQLRVARVLERRLLAVQKLLGGRKIPPAVSWRVLQCV